MKNNPKRGVANSRILLVCGNGYVFEEVFQPVIEQLASKYDLYLIVADDHVTPVVQDLIAEMLAEKVLVEGVIENLYPRNEKRSEYHKRAYQLARKWTNIHFDLAIFSTGFQIIDRYFLNFLVPQKTPTLVLQTGTLVGVMEKYYYPDGYMHVDFLRKVVRKIRAFKVELGKIPDRFFYPFLYANTFFPKSKVCELRFPGHLNDFAICYDPVEKQALEELAPNLKEVFVAEHPACDLSSETGRKKGVRNKLLVCFSGNLSTELEAEKFDKWQQTIKAIVANKAINEVHLRLHPRTLDTLLWPKRMAEVLENSGCSVKVLKGSDVSFIKSLGEYDGLLSAPSGTMRVARCIHRDIFIVGLVNCSDGGADDQDWILGAGEGLKWIKDGEIFNPGLLQLDHHYKVSRPKIGEIIDKLISGYLIVSDE